MSSQSEMSDAASLYRRIPPSIGALEREAAERERAAAEDRLRASRIWAKRVKGGSILQEFSESLNAVLTGPCSLYVAPELEGQASLEGPPVWPVLLASSFSLTQYPHYLTAESF